MLAGPLNFQQLTKFHWDHKWTVVELVSFFLCGVQGLGFFHSFLPSVIGSCTEQCQAVCECQTTGGSATAVPHVAVALPAVGAAAVFRNTAVSRGSFGFFRKSHPAFLAPRFPLFWDHFPKLWVLYYKQHEYAEVTFSEKIGKMRKDSGWLREFVKSEVATDIQSEALPAC